MQKRGAKLHRQLGDRRHNVFSMAAAMQTYLGIVAIRVFLSIQSIRLGMYDARGTQCVRMRFVDEKRVGAPSVLMLRHRLIHCCLGHCCWRCRLPLHVPMTPGSTRHQMRMLRSSGGACWQNRWDWLS